ncbi:hypothetical protein BCR35DRAFT_329187 [Leucosporidium creatinivorum]|uniref:Uncharacterized protein n=1 Tax=Leucosporidium creatinivorum TaxID=106004 RepID=A0A1Y2G469_9BASI|nr:hypothetical protein BCR35DRAFT_329187 [Leucosporidium creatinivorum]
MPSNGTTFLVAIIVPTSAVLLIIIWTIFAYFKFRALVRAHPAASRSIAEQGADRRQSVFSTTRRTSKLLEVIPPPPPSPTFTIQTAMSRSGSRVLVRGRRSSSKRREGEKAPMPERARKVAVWGVGEGGDSQGGDPDTFGYGAQGYASSSGHHLRQHSADVPSAPPTSPFQLGFNTSIRRRNGTWHEHDLEILSSAAPPPPPVVIFAPVGERPLFGARISSSEGDHVESGGAGSQESGYEANGLLAGTRAEQERLEAEEDEEEFRRYTAYTALDMAESGRPGRKRLGEGAKMAMERPLQPGDATPPFADSPRAMSLHSGRQRTIANNDVPPVPPRNPARQLDALTHPSMLPFDRPRSLPSRYSLQSALPAQPRDRTSTYTTHSQQSHYPDPNRLSVASNYTDYSHTERENSRPPARPPSGESAPTRHHSLGPSPSHRLSYPSSSPFALQRARSDPPQQVHRTSRDVSEESDITSNTFGVPDLHPRLSRSMSPDALEELELVASRFQETKASLLASYGEPNRAYPPRPPYWLSREGSSGTLLERAPLDEATRLKLVNPDHDHHLKHSSSSYSFARY